MSDILPPVPVNSPFNSYNWQDWYQKVRVAINNAAVIFWTQLNFTGSNLTDLQTRRHNDLTDIQGGTTNEYYHLTNAQQTALVGGFGILKNKSTDPTTSDIVAGNYAMYKNTTTSLIKLWVNDAGTMKSVTLT